MRLEITIPLCLIFGALVAIASELEQSRVAPLADCDHIETNNHFEVFHCNGAIVEIPREAQ